MSPSTISSRERAFVKALEELVVREQRTTLAALRRGLGKPPATVAETFPFVAQWLPANISLREAEPYYLVASLFASYQIGWEGGEGDRPTNLGTSLARLATAIRRDTGGQISSVERHFIALLGCDREDLPNHLRYAVGLLRSRSISVNWATLLHDLRLWDREDCRIQRAWGQAFWGRPEELVDEQDYGKQADAGGDEATQPELPT